MYFSTKPVAQQDAEDNDTGLGLQIQQSQNRMGRTGCSFEWAVTQKRNTGFEQLAHLKWIVSSSHVSQTITLRY